MHRPPGGSNPGGTHGKAPTEQHGRQQRGPIPTGSPRGPQHREGTTPLLPPSTPMPVGAEVRMAPPAPELAPSCMAKQRTQLVN